VAPGAKSAIYDCLVIDGMCMWTLCQSRDVCVGSLSQLILVSVLNCLYDSVSHMLRKNVEKRALIDNMDGIFLAIDEICDNGYEPPAVEPLFSETFICCTIFAAHIVGNCNFFCYSNFLQVSLACFIGIYI